MDSLKSFVGGGDKPTEGTQQGQPTEKAQSGGGGFLGGISDKINSAAGGGPESEKREDPLDKGVCDA